MAVLDGRQIKRPIVLHETNWTTGVFAPSVCERVARPQPCLLVSAAATNTIGIHLPTEPKTMLSIAYFKRGLLRERVRMEVAAEYRAKLLIDTLDERSFTMAPREDRSERKRPGIAPDLSSREFCRQKAEECLNLSYQITDPKGQVAVLKLANSWKRLAESN